MMLAKISAHIMLKVCAAVVSISGPGVSPPSEGAEQIAIAALPGC